MYSNDIYDDENGVILPSHCVLNVQHGPSYIDDMVIKYHIKKKKNISLIRNVNVK